MRFKAPPSHSSSIGWRVEFRTLDIQLTDYENSAFIILMGMITNVLNCFDINFFMPISLIDENMNRAHKRDAVTKEKFWWRTKNISRSDFENSDLKASDFVRSSLNSIVEEQDSDVLHELYLHEILGGKQEIGYIGILPLIERYMDVKNYTQ